MGSGCVAAAAVVHVCVWVLSALFRGLFVIVYACVIHVVFWHVHGFVAMFQDAPGLV